MAARNRARPSLMKEDNSDEMQLWQSIVEKIRRAAAANKKYEDLTPKFAAAEDKLSVISDSTSNVNALAELEALNREGLKHAEAELKILHEEPDDLIKNLELLMSVRTAMENEAPRSATTLKSRNLKRRRDDDNGVDSPAPTPDPATTGPRASKVASRSGSVAASVKQEPIMDTTEGVKPVATDRQSLFKVGAEVFYRNKDKKSEGEGILCSITSILGEGKQRRFEIQDVEPEADAEGNFPAPYRASVASLVPIPLVASGLPEFQRGKQVYALYPGTTTFYKAEMAGMKTKEMCRLRFEGEEERDKEMEVERRYVLDTNQIK